MARGRVLAALIAVFLLAVCCALPASALAQEDQVVTYVVKNEEQLLTAIGKATASGATVRLESHIVMTKRIELPANAKVTLDLNNKKVGRKVGAAKGDADGVIFVPKSATLSIVDTSPSRKGAVTGGHAKLGGTILNEGRTELTSVSVTNGYAKGDGGGIANLGTMIVTGCVIEGCVAEGSGGGIYNEGNLTLNARVRNCSATDGGGILSRGTIDVSRCTITGNQAKSRGGAIAIADLGGEKPLTFSIVGSTITANTAVVDGAVVADLCQGSPSTHHQLRIEKSCVITNNRCEQRTIIGCLPYVDLTMDGVEVRNNTVGTEVGCAVASYTDIAVSGKVVIKDNVSPRGSVGDLYLMRDGQLHVTGALEQGSRIGLLANGVAAFATTDYGKHCGQDPTTIFYSDDNYGVNLRKGDVWLCAPVRYLDEHGTTQVCSNYIPVFSEAPFEEAGFYVLYDDRIFSRRLNVYADVSLIINGSMRLECRKGIELAGAKSSLAIYDGVRGTGTLSCDAEEGKAGIEAAASGSHALNVFGGHVEATGGSGGAGIGGAGTLDVRIERGSVVARGGEGAAGIGGNKGVAGSPVSVRNATVDAEGGTGAAGIGGGSGAGLDHDVTFEGKVDVDARGGTGAAGIGGGTSGTFTGTCSIMGEVVWATSGGSGAQPIGHGKSGKDAGAVRLFDGATVRHLSTQFAPAAERERWCREDTFAAIDRCRIHQLRYRSVDETGHEVSCAYCKGVYEAHESHGLTAEGGHACRQCGYRMPRHRVRYAYGDSSRDSEEVWAGEPITLADGDELFDAPRGLMFRAWQIDGSEYQAGESLVLEKDLVATALFDRACTVNFSPGEGSGTMQPVTLVRGATLELPRRTTFAAPSGTALIGWEIAGTMLPCGRCITVTESMTVTARWGVAWKDLQRQLRQAPSGSVITLTNDVYAAADDEPLLVARGKRVTIDLAGHAIDRNLSETRGCGYVMRVAGELTIRDTSEAATGRVCGGLNTARANDESARGGGVCVEAGGAVVLESGTVTGSVSDQGGGIYLCGGYGGAPGGTLTMRGGAIRGNRAVQGGGVYVGYNARLSMLGGEIDGNVVGSSADAAGGGVYCGRGSVVALAGLVQVVGNANDYLGTKPDDMMLEKVRITFAGSLDAAARVGVSTIDGPAPNNFVTQGMGGRATLDNFVCNYPGAGLRLDSDTDIVLVKTVTISFEAGLDGATGTMGPMTVAQGGECILPPCGFAAPAGHLFRAWVIGDREYAAGSPYYVRSESVVARAAWDEAVTVTYAPGEGTGEPLVSTVARGSKVKLPTECPFTPPRGTELVGWLVGDTKRDLGDDVDAVGDLTITARYDMSWSGLQELIDSWTGAAPIVLSRDLHARPGDVALSIPAGADLMLDLAGHVLDRAATESAGGEAILFAGPGAHLKLIDSVGGGRITGARGVAAIASEHADTQVTLWGGTLDGNDCERGVVSVNGSFTMLGGSIEGNRGTVASAFVADDADATYPMHVMMLGGTIRKNEGASAQTGCVVVRGEAFELSGMVEIRDNKSKGKLANVCLADGARIVCPMTLDATSSVGVSSQTGPTSTAPVQLTRGLAGTDGQSSYEGTLALTSDYGGFETLVANGEAYLVTVHHVYFRPGEGTGRMPEYHHPPANPTTLPACTFEAPEGMQFEEWEVTMTGFEPIEAQPGDVIYPASDTVCLARWTEHAHVLAHVDAKEPTCEDPGCIEHWRCVAAGGSCGRLFADAEGTHELSVEETVVAPLGHLWSPYGYAWKSNRNRVDAVRTCRRDPSHVERHAATTTVTGVSEPTCTTPGYVTYLAHFEGEGLSDQTARFERERALGHLWGDASYVWSDDSSHVTATRVCERDGAHVEREVVETTSTEVVPATCETPSRREYAAVFSNPAFGQITRTVEAGEPLGHLWGPWELELAPTCAREGVERRVCERDASHSERRAVPYDSEGHDYDAGTVVREPTCTKPGLRRYVCKNDSEHVRCEELASLGHTAEGPTVTNEVAPTCTEAGSHEETFTCATCGEVLWSHHVVDEPLGHDWGPWEEVIGTQDVTAPREEARTCSRCGERQTRLLTGEDHVHELEHVEAIAARCERAGMREHYRCRVCAALFEDADGKVVVGEEQLVVKALGHLAGEAQTFGEASAGCETAGSALEVTFCERCGRVLSSERAEVASGDHLWGEGVVTREATCTTPGVVTYRCGHDPDHLRFESVAPLGHLWGEPVYEWDQWKTSCTATHTCLRDESHVESEKADATLKTIVEATPDADGLVRCTATFKNPAFAAQQTDVSVTYGAAGGDVEPDAGGDGGKENGSDLGGYDEGEEGPSWPYGPDDFDPNSFLVDLGRRPGDKHSWSGGDSLVESLASRVTTPADGATSSSGSVSEDTVRTRPEATGASEPAQVSEAVVVRDSQTSVPTSVTSISQPMSTVLVTGERTLAATGEETVPPYALSCVLVVGLGSLAIGLGRRWT